MKENTMKTAKQIMKSKSFIKSEMDRQLPEEISNLIWQNATDQLASMLKQYSTLPAGVRGHTDHFIFPAAAIYLSAREILNEQTAYRIIENAAVTQTEKAAKILRALMRIPGMPSLFVRVWDPMTRKKFGPDSGFENVFYAKQKGEYRVDIIACPYCRYFTELGCPELTKIFCANDNRTYGNLPGIRFERTGTLGTGADRCDFYVRKV